VKQLLSLSGAMRELSDSEVGTTNGKWYPPKGADCVELLVALRAPVDDAAATRLDELKPALAGVYFERERTLCSTSRRWAIPLR
jgi:hypothetical protein